MNMPIHIALVAEGTGVGLAELTRTSAALQKQVVHDFGPIWHINATVDAFATLEDVPLGYWPVIVKENIRNRTALGFHVDKNGQPYALVKLEGGWELTASHETLEMLADPFGNRIVSSPSIKPDQGRVQYLVEVCDPSEAPEYGYSVNGILVSDFYTPHFFDPVDTGARYSFTGAISTPRTVLPGGYLSWFDPVGGHVWQQTYFGDEPEFNDLGVFDRNQSLRAEVDRLTQQAPARQPLAADSAPLTRAQASGDKIRESTTAWVGALREEIDALEG